MMRLMLRLPGQSGSRDRESSLSLGQETQKLRAIELLSFSALPLAREDMEEEQALNIFERSAKRCSCGSRPGTLQIEPPKASRSPRCPASIAARDSTLVETHDTFWRPQAFSVFAAIFLPSSCIAL